MGIGGEIAEYMRKDPALITCHMREKEKFKKGHSAANRRGERQKSTYQYSSLTL